MTCIVTVNQSPLSMRLGSLLMFSVQLCMCFGHLLSTSSLPEFFEECIQEEQYEARRLDIMRDAVRAKVSYNEESKRLNGHSKDGSLSPPPDDSSREFSPIPEDSQSSSVQNGGTA